MVRGDFVVAGGRRGRGDRQDWGGQGTISAVVDVATLCRVGNGDGGEQRSGVWVAWVLEHGGARPDLDDAAEIHDRDVVRDALHHGHVVADEQERQPQLGLDGHEQVQHLRLHRHVESGDGFVSNEQLRAGCQRAGDGDTLALPTRKFVRETADEIARELDTVEQVGDAVSGLAARCDREILQRLSDLNPEPTVWIERGKRVLEDHLHVTPGPAQLKAAEGADVCPVELDFAAVGLDQAQDRAPAGGLAAAGFADEGEGLAGGDGEADVLDGVHVGDAPAQHAAADGEAGAEVFDLQ